MPLPISKKVLTALQVVSMAVLVGASLFVYNDWRSHRTEAASPGSAQTSTEGPLTLPDQSVSGNVEVDPNGTVKQVDGTRMRD